MLNVGRFNSHSRDLGLEIGVYLIGHTRSNYPALSICMLLFCVMPTEGAYVARTFWQGGIIWQDSMNIFSESFRIRKLQQNGVRIWFLYIFNWKFEWNWTSMTIDLTTRQTFWNMLLGSYMIWTCHVTFSQSCVQRIVALPTLADSRLSLVLFCIGVIFIMFINFSTGIIMYAYYHDCDPLQAKVSAALPICLRQNLQNTHFPDYQQSR